MVLLEGIALVTQRNFGIINLKCLLKEFKYIFYHFSR